MTGLFQSMLRMGSEKTRSLTLVAGAASALFFGIALGSTLSNGLFLSWLMLILATVLLIAVAVFAWRRWRLAENIKAAENQVYVSSGVVSADASDPADTFFETVYVELQNRDAQWLPGVEATQRAMVQAAGGTVNAPYLKADLRITMLSFIGTLIAVPLAASGAFITLLLWLLA